MGLETRARAALCRELQHEVKHLGQSAADDQNRFFFSYADTLVLHLQESTNRRGQRRGAFLCPLHLVLHILHRRAKSLDERMPVWPRLVKVFQNFGLVVRAAVK
jgi:hypothetical protein